MKDSRKEPGTDIARVPQHSTLLLKLGAKYQVDPNKIVGALKQTAFRQREGEVSDAQMMALLVVADQYNLNPWTREIFAFPDKNNGIVPVVGVDGWSRIINSHPQFDGMEFAQSDHVVSESDDPESLKGCKPCPEWIECIMHRKDHAHAVVVREYLDECYRLPFEGKRKDGGTYSVNGPWQSHTKRMLRHKTMIQAGRIAFGFVGIFDPDEAERINEAMAASVVATVKPTTREPLSIEEARDARDEKQRAEVTDRAIHAGCVTIAQLAELQEAIESAGLSVDMVLDYAQVASLPELQTDKFGETIDWILSSVVADE